MQQQQEMDLSLAKELTEGEELLWSGRPDPNSKSIVSPASVFFILGIIFTVVGLALLIGGFVILGVVEGRGRDASVALFIIGGTFLFLGIIFAISGLAYRVTPRNTMYAVTNKRAIILRAGRYLTVDSYGKNEIGQVRRLERPDGTGDLIFGMQRAASGYGYGSGYGYYGGYSSYGGYSGTGMSRYGAGMFNGIANVHAVEQIVLNVLK